MGKFKDLTGQKYGNLTVIERAENAPNGRVQWKCVCDCGNQTVCRAFNLQNGHTRSCGCLHEEGTRTTHGMKRSRLYRIWESMKTRCNNPSSQRYEDYGGRGIKVCNDWEHFEAFRDWALANGYQEHLTIDRKDNDGPYSPENCRWATMKAQQSNKRNNFLLTHNGKTLTISQWAAETGIERRTIAKRKKLGWSDAEALTIPVRKQTRRN